MAARYYMEYDSKSISYSEEMQQIARVARICNYNLHEKNGRINVLQSTYNKCALVVLVLFSKNTMDCK